MCKNQKYFPLLGWKPNEVNANYYKKQNKHYLSAHFDDRRLSGELLANISLRGDCEMEFANPQHKNHILTLIRPYDTSENRFQSRNIGLQTK